MAEFVFLAADLVTQGGLIRWLAAQWAVHQLQVRHPLGRNAVEVVIVLKSADKFLYSQAISHWSLPSDLSVTPAYKYHHNKTLQSRIADFSTPLIALNKPLMYQGNIY